jgi:hypothetical protein
LRQRGEPVSRNALGRWQRPQGEEEIRAARYYAAAAELAYRDWTDARTRNERPDKQLRSDIEILARTGALSPEAIGRFDQVAAEYGEALDMADRGAVLAFSRFPPHGFENYPRMYALENLERPATSRTLSLIGRGRGDDAARALWGALKLRRAHARNVPWMVEPVIDLQALLEHTQPSAQRLAQIQDAFREREEPDRVERELRENRAILIELMFAEWYGRRADPLTPAAHLQWTWSPLAPLRPWVVRQTTSALRLWEEVVEAAVQPWPAKIDALGRIAARQPTIPTGTLRVATRLDILLQSRYMAQHNATTAAARAAAQLAQVRSAVATVAIERYRRDHGGQTPATLNELVPWYLESVPTDPFTGMPLHYRTDTTRFVTYSVGADRTNDGGHVGPLPIHLSSVTSKDVGLEIRLHPKEERK